MTGQSISDFQTGTGSAVYASLDTGQLISYTRTTLVNTIASLQGSDGGAIPVLKVYKWLTKIDNILDNALSKQVINTSHLVLHQNASLGD